MAKPIVTYNPPNRYTPRPEEIPSGICECGCGKLTPPARKTARKLRNFRGYSLPYIPSHNGTRKTTGHGPNWKGGRAFSGGYVRIHKPDHPNANCAGYVLEHRLEWEKANGRLLATDEIVHHGNRVKSDNQGGNLERMTPREHGLEHADEFKERMRKAREADPELCSKAGKKSGRWKGHIKNDPNCPHCAIISERRILTT